MNIPTGFKRWRFHWFECPSCGHRAYRTFANVRLAREPVRMVWRFWCERCGAFATLSRPIMPSINALILLVLLGPIGFAILYRAFLAGLPFESLVSIVGLLWLVQPLVFLAVTRWMYRYVPPDPGVAPSEPA